jgi:hypothetical protein
MRRAIRSAIGFPVAAVALTTVLLVGGCGSGGTNNTTTTQSGAAFSVAQVLLFRGGAHAENGLEVLLAKNGPDAPLSPNTWVFPGGGVRSNAGGAPAARAAALKSLGDSGVTLSSSDLIPYAHWIAPGFDTIFYLALAPPDATPSPGFSDKTDVGWFDPKRALAQHEAGHLAMEYITVKQLESLSDFPTAQDAIQTARSREVKPIHLEIVGEGPGAHAVLPSDAPQG